MILPINTAYNVSLKEVMHFFRQLTAGMGENMKFIIEHVCEDDEMTAGVNWHLGKNYNHQTLSSIKMYFVS